MARPTLTSSSPARLWRQWLKLVLGISGFGGMLAILVVSVSRQGWRLDLTPDRRFSLSEHATKVLQQLDRDVHVVAFVQANDPRNREIEDLLHRASLAGKRLHYEVVDLNRNPALARQYGVGSYASFVVECGDLRRGFTNPREDLLIQAVLQVTRQLHKIVYFSVGHGEGDIRNTDRRQGYSQLRAILQKEFIETRPLDLSETVQVPRDASAVVILGSEKDWFLTDLLALQAYIDDGGRVLLMLDPSPLPNLTSFAARYGIRLAPGIVVDPEARLFAGDRLTFAANGGTATQTISSALKEPPLLSTVRPVAYPQSKDARVEGVEFLHSSASSWVAKTDDPRVAESSPRNAADAGPVSVGVAVAVTVKAEKTHQARLVVLGDSDFADNSLLDHLGNHNLVLNTIDWLTGDESVMGERSGQQVAGINQLFVSEEQGRWIFLTAVVVEPSLFVLAGIIVLLRRRWN